MNKAIIFDLDGTLWDSTGSIPEIWNKVLLRNNINILMTQKNLQSLMGKTMYEIGDILFPALDRDHRNRIMDECGQEEVIYLEKHGAVLYEGLKDTLSILSKDYGLYIVSNCQENYVRSFLRAHNLMSWFTDYEESGRTGLSKADNIRMIMERNHIRQAAYVGDTEGDESAARHAGIPFIYAAYGFGTAQAPDAVIDSISQLPAAVNQGTVL